MISPDSRAQRARCQAETPLIDLFKFASPALALTCTPGESEINSFALNFPRSLTLPSNFESLEKPKFDYFTLGNTNWVA